MNIRWKRKGNPKLELKSKNQNQCSTLHGLWKKIVMYKLHFCFIYIFIYNCQFNCLIRGRVCSKERGADCESMRVALMSPSLRCYSALSAFLFKIYEYWIWRMSTLHQIQQHTCQVASRSDEPPLRHRQIIPHIIVWWYKQLSNVIIRPTVEKPT